MALNLTADRAAFTNVRLLGQYTLLINDTARSDFRASYSEGTVDFIFGGGIAVFEQSQIHQIGSGGNITTASTPATRPYGFLFYRSSIIGDRARELAACAVDGASRRRCSIASRAS